MHESGQWVSTGRRSGGGGGRGGRESRGPPTPLQPNKHFKGNIKPGKTGPKAADVNSPGGQRPARVVIHTGSVHFTVTEPKRWPPACQAHQHRPGHCVDRRLASGCSATYLVSSSDRSASFVSHCTADLHPHPLSFPALLSGSQVAGGCLSGEHAGGPFKVPWWVPCPWRCPSCVPWPRSALCWEELLAASLLQDVVPKMPHLQGSGCQEGGGCAP